MRSLRRILALSAKEVRHVMRDPRSLYLALGMPVVMILLFGFGVSFDLDHLELAFVDLDQSASSREVRRRMCAGPTFDDEGDATLEDAERRLVAGEVIAVVVFERGFERNLRRGSTATMQLLVDGSDNNSASQTRARAETMGRVFGFSVASSGAGGVGDAPITARTWTRFNPEGRSAIFLVPGIASFVLAIVCVLLTALTVAREWERGSMAQLFATPVARFEIVIGKLLPYVVLGSIAVLLVLAVGMWVFDVPFVGSAPTLALISVLFIAGMLGQGLLISVVTRNQMVATQVATLSSMLPSLLLSGFVFPVDNMPFVLQQVSRVIPARYFVEGLRGVLLRGNGIEQLWPQVVALAVFAFVVLAASTARFRRTIA